MLTVNGKSQLYGIVGMPLSHSLSPLMQNAAFVAANINAVYVPFRIVPERLLEAMKSLGWAGLSGFNLTAPYKQLILPLLDEMTPEAKTVQSVNTVLCGHKENRIHMRGHNTDGLGFLDSLKEAQGWQSKNKRVLLLGAGGAARSIAFSMIKDGCSQLWVANRTVKKATLLVADMQQYFGHHATNNLTSRVPYIQAISLRDTDQLTADLLINTTSVGTNNQSSPVSLEKLNIQEMVVDIIYSPLETPLLKQAKKIGLKHLNGLGMLLHQGAHTFHFWTNKTAPLEVMRKSLVCTNYKFFNV